MKKIITICSSMILGVFCLGCSKDSTTAPTADRFTISIAESEKGIVDPHGDFTVQQADSINIKAKNSQDGYRFLKWQITNGSNNISIRDTAGDSTYVADIEGDAEIEAVFVKDTFNLFVTSDIYGTANDEGHRRVAFRESTTISAGSADTAGYEFSHWDIGNSPKYEISADDIHKHTALVKNVTGNDTIKAIYTLKTCTLSVSANQYGTSDPNGEVYIQHFGSQIIRAANPDPGYEFTEWSILEGNDFFEIEEPDKDSTRIINITGNGSVRANFDRIRYAIRVTSGEGGSAVNENINRSVPYMDTTHISIDDTDIGWEFQQWVVDDDQSAKIDNPTASSTYVKAVSGNAIVTAVFSKKRYPLTVVQPGAGGIITDINGNPLEEEYEHGTDVEIMINLSRGYAVSEWIDDGSGNGTTTSLAIVGSSQIGINLNEIAVPSHVICVDAASTYNGTEELGTTWVKAYDDLSDGVQALHDNSEKTQIWVAEGRYVAPTSGYGFSLVSNDTLYGGFSACESFLSDRTFHKQLPILDGENNASNVIDIYNCDNIRIDGFIIQKGSLNGIYIGGGSSQGNHMISNCVLRENNDYAIQIRVPNVTIMNCVFRDNVGGIGSALLTNNNTKVKNSVFFNNQGSAIEDKNTSTVDRTQFYNCTIYNNTSENEYPGGIFSEGNIDITGCILFGNTSPAGYVGTQVNSVFNAYECVIENASSGFGIGDTNVNGDVSRILEVDPEFVTQITTDDSEWFRPNVQAVHGVLIPGDSIISHYGTYSLGRPTHDIRNNQRAPTGFALGAYERE